MNKKFIWMLVLMLVIVAGGVFYFLYDQSLQVNIQNNTTYNNNSVECYDCGEGGWQRMDKKCGQTIPSKNDFKSCLMNFSWASVNQHTSAEEIKEGYIEIGGVEILKSPTANSIKVFIYHQWAVDKDGKLYLLGQLG